MQLPPVQPRSGHSLASCKGPDMSRTVFGCGWGSFSTQAIDSREPSIQTSHSTAENLGAQEADTSHYQEEHSSILDDEQVPTPQRKNDFNPTVGVGDGAAKEHNHPDHVDNVRLHDQDNRTSIALHTALDQQPEGPTSWTTDEVPAATAFPGLSAPTSCSSLWPLNDQAFQAATAAHQNNQLTASNHWLDHWALEQLCRAEQEVEAYKAVLAAICQAHPAAIAAAQQALLQQGMCADLPMCVSSSLQDDWKCSRFRAGPVSDAAPPQLGSMLAAATCLDYASGCIAGEDSFGSWLAVSPAWPSAACLVPETLPGSMPEDQPAHDLPVELQQQQEEAFAGSFFFAELEQLLTSPPGAVNSSPKPFDQADAIVFPAVQEQHVQEASQGHSTQGRANDVPTPSHVQDATPTELDSLQHAVAEASMYKQQLAQAHQRAVSAAQRIKTAQHHLQEVQQQVSAQVVRLEKRLQQAGEGLQQAEEEAQSALAAKAAAEERVSALEKEVANLCLSLRQCQSERDQACQEEAALRMSLCDCQQALQQVRAECATQTELAVLWRRSCKQAGDV